MTRQIAIGYDTAQTAVLEQRIAHLEEQVATLAEALRTLATRLEDSPGSGDYAPTPGRMAWPTHGQR